jgi:hypothetical protein
MMPGKNDNGQMNATQLRSRLPVLNGNNRKVPLFVPVEGLSPVDFGTRSFFRFISPYFP